MAKVGPKLVCLVYCFVFCILVIAIGIWLAVVAASFEQPEVNIKKVTPVAFELGLSECTITYDVRVNVSNSNSWPIEGSVDSLTATVHSLDKESQDTVGEILYMSRAFLPEAVDIEANSDVLFSIFVDMTIAATGSNADLFARITRDCAVSTARTTKIRITLSGVKAEVAGISIDLGGIEVPLDMEVNCDNSAETTTTTEASVMLPLP